REPDASPPSSAGLLRRQREFEPGSPALAPARFDLAAMCAHDCAADGEPQSRTDHGAFFVAALKFLEQLGGLAGREAGTLVLYEDPNGVAVVGRGDRGAGTGRRVLGDVVEQIAEELYDEPRIHVDRRQVG